MEASTVITMRAFKLALALMLLFPAAALAQYTQVSATVQDVQGHRYVNCTYSVAFIGQSSLPGPYLLGGQSVFQTLYAGASCDSNGVLSIRLPQNSSIYPQPSQWKFAICSAAGYIGGPYCFTNLETITGASQDITNDLQAVAPLLPSTGGGGTAVAGTPNQIIATLGIAITTLSLANPVIFPGGGTFNGTLNVAGGTPAVELTPDLFCNYYGTGTQDQLCNLFGELVWNPVGANGPNYMLMFGRYYDLFGATPPNGSIWWFNGLTGQFEVLNGVTGGINCLQLNPSGTPLWGTCTGLTGVPGGIVYFSSPTTDASSGQLNLNVLVKGGGAGGAPSNSQTTDDGVNPVVSPNGYDVSTTGGYDYQVPNNGTTGTALQLVACNDGSQKAITCPHASSITNQPIGFVFSGAGTTGNAKLCVLGWCQVKFDNATTAGHFAIESSTVDGQLHDAGTTLVAGQPNFYIWNANAGAGTVATVRLLIADDFLNSALASQYKKLRCEPGLGDGLNAIAAGTYLQSTCYNDSGVTWTITGIRCFTDNSGTSTLNATNGSSVGLLTGAITCTNAFAAGTQSATTTIANGDYVKFTFVADGTSKQTTWVVSFTQ